MDGGTQDIAARVAADHEALHAHLDGLLAAAAKDGDRPFDDAVRAEFLALIEAAREHFHREEIWMDAAGLITLSHALDHDRLTGELTALVDRAAAGELSAKETAHRMADVLGEHEIGLDMAAFAIRLSPVTW
jgi:hemerythrin